MIGVLVTLATAATCLPGLLKKAWRDSLIATCRRPKLVLMGFGNPISLAAYFGLMFLAMHTGAPATAVVLVDHLPTLDETKAVAAEIDKIDRAFAPSL